MADQTKNGNGDSVDRTDAQRSWDELREKLNIPSRESLEKRRELLKRQAAEIVKKYGGVKNQT